MKKVTKKKSASVRAKKVAKKPTKKSIKTKKVSKSKKPIKKVTKASPKKSTKKNLNSKLNKSIKRISTKRSKPTNRLIFAFGDQCFWIKDGPILRDLIDLRNVLYEITQEQFDHHVDELKNDFASWVEHVLEDEHTSALIQKAKTAKKMLAAIEKSLPKKHRR